MVGGMVGGSHVISRLPWYLEGESARKIYSKCNTTYVLLCNVQGNSFGVNEILCFSWCMRQLRNLYSSSHVGQLMTDALALLKELNKLS